MKKFVSAIIAVILLATSCLPAFAQGPAAPQATNQAQTWESVLKDQLDQVTQNLEKLGQGTLLPAGEKWRQTLTQRKTDLEKKLADLQEKTAQFRTKREEHLAFVTSLRNGQTQIKGAFQENKQIVSENRQLRQQLATLLRQRKESGEALSDETLASIKSLHEEIAAIHEQLKSTSGQMEELRKQNAQAIADKDYVTMDLIYDQIVAIQTTRNEKIKEVNGLLVQIIELL